jgi:hypothetical protein
VPALSLPGAPGLPLLDFTTEDVPLPELVDANIPNLSLPALPLPP